MPEQSGVAVAFAIAYHDACLIPGHRHLAEQAHLSGEAGSNVSYVKSSEAIRSR